MTFVDKDLLSVQEARILMERAGEAAAAMAAFPQEKLDHILEAMLKAVAGQLDTLSRMSAQETGYGEEMCIRDSNWTTRNPEEFVTEVIVPVTKESEDENIPL